MVGQLQRIDVVRDWAKSSLNAVEVLPGQGPTHGGLLVDGGWIRVLGAGHPRLPRSLSSWNRGRLPGAWLVADDVVGGFFAVNAGRFGDDVGNVWRFAPEARAWEPLDRSYADFLRLCLDGDLERFYAGWRWPSWRDDVKKLAGGSSYALHPSPWTMGPRFAMRARRVVDVAILFDATVRARAA